MNERIARLAAYAQGHEIYPEIVKVDYDRCDLFLTELKRDTKRLSVPPHRAPAFQ